MPHVPSCKPYVGIDRLEFDRLREDLNKEGFSVPNTDVGEISGAHKIKLSWEYQEPTKTLGVCILHCPWYIGESEVWHRIDMVINPYVG